MKVHSTPMQASRILALSLAAALLTSCAVADGQLDEGGVANWSPDEPDPAYHEAAVALMEHRPWRARVLLTPAIADETRRTPALVLLAADVAAASERWMEVSLLLSGESWVDSLFDGRARLLLARAALGRGMPTSGLRHARAALDDTQSERLRGRAFALEARALDRLDRDEEARIAYDSAAELLPTISDWLWLRSAALCRDSADRYAYYDLLTTDVARKRAGWNEALTRERLGQARAAIRIYDSLGTEDSRMASMRMRAATVSSRRDLTAVRRELVAFIDSASGSDEARTMIEALDSRWRTHPASEDLIVARSAAHSGPLSRAAAGYARAFSKTRPSEEDRFAYGLVLARMRRSDRALRQFALIKPPSPLAGDAAFQRARILLRRKKRVPAIKALRAVVKTYAEDTSAASAALMLLADLTPEAHDLVWEVFLDALEPLRAAGKLGAVLLQYPRWFMPNRENAEVIAEARARLGDIPCGVEFRHRSWLGERLLERTVKLLERERMSYVIVDEPQGMRSSVPPVVAVTSPSLAIVRLHGRRADTWERPTNPVSERYRYLYDREELTEWVPRIEEAARSATTIHTVFNNCYGNYGTTNAVEFAGMMATDD